MQPIVWRGAVGGALSLGYRDAAAPGVETAEQLALLRRLQCAEMQGFLIAPALAPEAFEALLAASAEALATA